MVYQSFLDTCILLLILHLLTKSTGKCALSTVNQTLLLKKSKSTGTLDSRFTSLEFDGNDIMTSTGTLDSRFTSLEYDGDDIMTSCPGSSDIGRPSSSLSSPQILETDTFSWVSHQATFGDATTSDDRPEFSSENQIDVDLEIERLRSELRPPQKLYPMTRIDAIDGSKVVPYYLPSLSRKNIKLLNIAIFGFDAYIQIILTL
ncbi:hypothetical protein Vadar_019762 [Vaccinium darrowii]|uniref:Uncharacterized protein n=1 Tax=Vaccinium darrowii TaxID=229202 RepID=A0ACB7Y0X3_9ERIC|nr:hypothetical protein Vadar_019762 [Vaccinium darrowii]